MLVILGLAALVVYERYTESAEARKRADQLKRWMHSQEPHPSSEAAFSHSALRDAPDQR